MKTGYLKISVITPSFNQGQFIEETILSVINQDYTNFEYIIIDGGSKDNTVEVIRKYEQHVTYWASEKDNGQSEAINKGFKKATGDIICWLNSDDVFLPGALKKVANYFENHRKVDMLTAYTLLIDEYSRIISNVFAIKLKQWYAKRGVFYITQQSTFWKREMINAVGLLNEDFHTQMDKELIIRIFENKSAIGHFGKIVAGFRLHHASKGAMGPESNINTNDLSKLEKMYGQKYSQRPILFFQIIYGIEKLIKGLYLKKMLFILNWRGKNVKDLASYNSIYLK